ncbi:MAG: recombination-associated protein RdgC [Rhodoferax sp.]|nr:recombination-associated protein RdgC [Rhodoferax sp.]
MFKNLMMFRVSGWPTELALLEEALASAQYVECSASQEKSIGWVPPRGHAHGALVEVVAGQWLLKLMMEVKVVPASVIKRKVQERMDQIEASTGRKPGKREKSDISDEVRLSLLPMAFSKQSSTQIWVDPSRGLLLTDAGSESRADELMTCLIKAISGLAARPINTKTAPSTAMSLWLSTKESPPGFSVDQECELKAADDSGATVRYTRHSLDTDEVSQHIAMGKVPTRLALTWAERVSFVLTDTMQLKKIAFLESVFEGAASSPSDGKDDDFDADVAIATGELSKLIPDLIEALGGEVLANPIEGG